MADAPVTALSMAPASVMAASVAAAPPGFRSCDFCTLSNGNDLTDTYFFCLKNGNDVTDKIFSSLSNGNDDNDTFFYASVTVTMQPIQFM
jgi:hypothetical protein